MHTLVFNTTEKTVKVLDGPVGDSKIISNFESVPTVKVDDRGYYEVLQELPEVGRLPVARLPIANTVMFIEK
jgi:hypothetical protein